MEGKARIKRDKHAGNIRQSAQLNRAEAMRRDFIRFILVLHGNLGEEQLGGASADAQSYWQGRFAACTFVERVWHTGRPWNCWGVAPNPTRDAVP